MVEGTPPRRAIPLLLLLALLTTVDCDLSPVPPPTVNASSQALLEKTIISSYISFHRANRNTAPRLVYRYNGTQPGFGNRVSNLLTAFTLASLSRRILLIDWREPYDLFTFYNARLNLKYSRGDEDKNEKDCSSVACKASLLSAVLPKRHRTVTYSTGLLHADLRLVKGLLRKHHDLPAAVILKDAVKEPLNQAQFFKKMFDALVTPGKEISQLLSAHKRDLKGEFIAVHARLGKGLHETGARYGHLAPGKLAACFAKHGVELGDQVGIRKFYLATDTSSFRPLFQWELKKRGRHLMSIGKMEPVHTKDCASHPRGCLQAVFEFMVLSRASGIVASKSTYSQVAGFIGGVEKFKTIKDGDCDI